MRTGGRTEPPLEFHLRLKFHLTHVEYMISSIYHIGETAFSSSGSDVYRPGALGGGSAGACQGPALGRSKRCRSRSVLPWPERCSSPSASTAAPAGHSSPAPSRGRSRTRA